MSRAPGLRKSHLAPLGWMSVDLSFKSMNLNQPYYFVNTQISWTEFLICSEAHWEDLKQKKENSSSEDTALRGLFFLRPVALLCH